jgi:hypothetical protein
MPLSTRLLPMLLTVGAGLWPASLAYAQAPADSALLSIPPGEEKVACRIPEPDTSRPAPEHLSLREFRIGGAAAGPIAQWPRRVLVAADSGGHPVVLYDAVVRASSGGAHAMAQFSPAANAGGWRQTVAVDSAALAALLAARDLGQLRNAANYGPQRPLSPSELDRARALAVWLWERRCGDRHSTGP